MKPIGISDYLRTAKCQACWEPMNEYTRRRSTAVGGKHTWFITLSCPNWHERELIYYPNALELIENEMEPVILPSTDQHRAYTEDNPRYVSEQDYYDTPETVAEKAKAAADIAKMAHAAALGLDEKRTS